MRRFAGVLLLLAGFLALADALWIQGKAQLGQHLLERSWTDAKVQGGRAQPPWPWADTRPIARLKIPALGVDQLILEGATGRQLAWGPVHVAPSARPGGPGHVVLSAHRDTHFLFLPKLEIGHEIQLEQPDGLSKRYRVTDRTILDQRTQRLALSPENDGLSLTTCEPHADPLAPTPLRLIVSATPVVSMPIPSSR